MTDTKRIEETTPSEHAECTPSDAVVMGLGSSPSGGATHVRALAAEVTKLRAERDEAQRISDLRLDDVARAVELAVRLSFVRNERDRLLETVAEVQMQVDEAYAAMHANRDRVRVVEQECNRLRRALQNIAHPARGLWDVSARVVACNALDNKPWPPLDGVDGADAFGSEVKL